MTDKTLPPLPEPFAHIAIIKTDAGPTKFFTAPSDPRAIAVYTADEARAALAAQKPEGEAVRDAWRRGCAVQYLVLAGYDDEWTDYVADCAPDTNSKRLAWRLKPAAPLAQAPAAPGWQPIETAPKDGTWVLLGGRTFRTSAKQVVCRWDGTGWESADDGYLAYIDPTHWMPTMPLPAAPEASK